MNDDNDRSTRAAFEDLKRSVDSAVDVESAHTRFEQLRAQPGAGHRSRRRWAIGAAAATVVVVVGLVTIWPSSNDETQVVTDGTIEPTTTEVARPTCPVPGQLFVYINPSASPPEVYDVSAYLGNLDGVDSLNYMDEAATYEEFTQLFADEPDLADSVEPGDLPTSFRPVREIPWDETTVSTLESLPGVKQVQTEPEQFTPDCVEPSPEDRDSEGANTEATGPANRDDVPGRGIVDQPLGPMVPTQPIEYSDDQRKAAGSGTYSDPVVHAMDFSLIGYVDRDDMDPTSRPADDTFPPPMVPIWNENRTQIGWWAANLGWVTFEEVDDEDFDFRERWLAERASGDAAAELHGPPPGDSAGP